jgi:hypothetical protein
MHKNATKCNETQSKWCKNKHGASKTIDTLETYHGCFFFVGRRCSSSHLPILICSRGNPTSDLRMEWWRLLGIVFPLNGIVLELDPLRGSCGLWGCVAGAARAPSTCKNRQMSPLIFLACLERHMSFYLGMPFLCNVVEVGAIAHGRSSVCTSVAVMLECPAMCVVCFAFRRLGCLVVL